jgi:hypothetical protein
MHGGFGFNMHGVCACRLFLATHLRDLDVIVDAIQMIRPTGDEVRAQ